MRTFIGWFGVTEGKLIGIKSRIGILLTLSIMYTVAFTNGGFADWTLNQMLPFTLPEIVGSLTIV